MDALFVYARPKFHSTGLRNNTEQCATVLREAGVDAMSLPLDTISLDGNNTVEMWEPFIRTNQPRMVVIAATSVPAAYQEQLCIEYPDVLWVRRIHSNLAWLFISPTQFQDCLRILELARHHRNLRYTVVSPEDAARLCAGGLDVLAMPNVLAGDIASEPRTQPVSIDAWLRVSAIFAIRLLKHPSGHLLTGAVLNARGRRTKVYIQGERTDSPAYVESLKRWANTLNLRLPVEPYRTHEEFVRWLSETIDIGLQLSATESFNYVAAEHLGLGIPVVASHAVPWCPWRVRYEDVEAAADTVESILEDYTSASARAIEAARQVQARHKEQFLSVCRTLLEDT